jgi:WD40 repeat protein
MLLTVGSHNSSVDIGQHAAEAAIRAFPNMGAEMVKQLRGVHGHYTPADPGFPDGRYLVEACIDGKVRIWDGQHKQLLQSIPTSDHFYTVVSISRDSRYVAIAAGFDVSVWELH